MSVRALRQLRTTHSSGTGCHAGELPISGICPALGRIAGKVPSAATRVAITMPAATARHCLLPTGGAGQRAWKE